MPRLAYIPMDLAEPADLVEAVRQRRGGAFSSLDRLLLHSPPLTRGWNYYLNQVRTQMTLDPKLRELGMCGVAVVNRAEYEFQGHLPEFLKHGGTQAQADALRDADGAAKNTTLFNAAERATIQLTIEMTRNVQVSDATFAAAKAALPTEQALVELIGTIATYNMVSRFLVALDLHG
jgi:alkylhydroperoxidase family enzyme